MVTNLITENASNTFLIGRNLEISNIIETLLRVEKPNVIITGEPGVGKTALINHLAYLIANDLVPEELKGYSLSEINLNDLLAGDGYRGVFEKKVQDLLVSATNKGKVILFMDEFHVAESLGKMQNGQTPGLGNSLKPYLTRGDIRIIGATTNDEYNEMTDKALLRRFRRIIIGEPNEEACNQIIQKCLERYNTRKIKVSDSKIVEKIFRTTMQIDGFNPDKITDITDIMFAKTRMNNVELLDAATVDLYLKQIVESKANQGSMMKL